MKKRQLLCVLPLLFGCPGAWAVITCNVSSPGFTVNPYVEGAAPATAPTSFTVTCSRTANKDNLSQNYSVSANGGLYASGGNRARATVGGTNYYVSYNLGVGSTCTTAWTGAMTGTINWTAKNDLTTRTATGNYAGCVPTQSGMAAAAYSDQLGLTLTYGTTTNAAVNAAVSITVGGTCSISQAPVNMAFTYQAFAASAVNVDSPFRARCTNAHPYTIALDRTSDVVQGLNYSLAVLTDPGNVNVPPSASVNGSGLDQLYKIRGTMAAGQAGTCSSGPCTATNPTPHTLTITY